MLKWIHLWHVRVPTPHYHRSTRPWIEEMRKNQNEARFKSMAAKRVEEKPCSMNRLSDVQLSLQPLNLCILVCIVFFRMHFRRSAIIFSYAFMDTQRTVIIFHCIIFGCVSPDRCFCTFYLSSVDWSFFLIICLVFFLNRFYPFSSIFLQ